MVSLFSWWIYGLKNTHDEFLQMILLFKKSTIAIQVVTTCQRLLLLAQMQTFLCSYCRELLEYLGKTHPFNLVTTNHMWMPGIEPKQLGAVSKLSWILRHMFGKFLEPHPVKSRKQGLVIPRKTVNSVMVMYNICHVNIYQTYCCNNYYHNININLKFVVKRH